VTEDILAVSGAPSDISTAAARVMLAFDHHSLRTSVYHSCTVIKISFYRRQILYSVRNNGYLFNHMNNQGAKWLGLVVLYEGETPDVEWVF